jgi:dTDP-4-dehydrorhamnose reductase
MRGEMKILLFGKHGQLGWELHRSLQGLGEILAYDYPEVDFRESSSLKRLVEDIKPQLVVNAAAYTDVDRAESEPQLAKLINSDTPGILSEACREQGAAFIHYSTDYVFDGQKGSPYTEDDEPYPLNVYGQTKLEGERAVIEAGGCYLIIRTAWVYSLRRDCFVTKVLCWAHTQNELRIVEDQISNPTWARALAEITAHLIAKAGSDPLPWLRAHRGIYHLAGSGFASRFEWARMIAINGPNVARQYAKTIHPAKSDDFPLPAIRPHNSALDCSRFGSTFDLHLPNWEVLLRLAMRV